MADESGSSTGHSGGDAARAGSDRAWRPVGPTSQQAERLEGYQDLREIGRGGDSVVYRARQIDPGREVAVKVLQVDEPDRVARFQREVQITVALGRQHPNIVNVLAVGVTESGRPALVMDFYEGGTLHDRLRAHGPFPAEEVVRIGVVLADALAFAHQQDVLHRDIKPQNVLVLPTSWVLADFGISRLSDSEHTASVETFTYRHASPQILDGYSPTKADDIWSLGSTLYTLLDSRPPFASDDAAEDSALSYLRRARTERHRELRGAGDEGLVAGLAEVIDQCLVKDPAGRIQSAQELSHALAGLRSTAWEPRGARSALPPTQATPAQASPAQANPAQAGPAQASPAQASAAVSPQPTSRDAGPTRHRARTRDEDAQWAPSSDSVESVSAEQPHDGEPAAASAEQVGEIAPVALSALAHGAETQGHGRAQVADAGPTGRVHDLATGEVEPEKAEVAPPAGSTSPEPAAPGGRRKAFAVLAVSAVIIGLILGGLGSMFRGENDEPQTESTPSPEPVPTLSTAPTQTGDAQPNQLPDPDLEFTIDKLTLGLTTAELSWNDPTEGTGRFVVSRTTQNGKKLALLDNLPPGTTKAQVNLDGVLEPGERVCFLVVVVTNGPFGNSQVRCGTWQN